VILGGPGQPPLVVGHRGFAAASPENTLVGIRAALAAGAWFDGEFAGEPLPLLRDLLAFVAAAPSRRHPERGLVLPRLFVEVKDAEAERPGVTAAVVAAIRYAGLIERSAIGSFRSDVLIAAAKLAPEVERHHIVEYLTPDSPDLVPYVHAVNHGERQLGALMVERIRGEGFAVHVWTVNDRREIRRLASWGVDGIISDDPAMARRVVDER